MDLVARHRGHRSRRTLASRQIDCALPRLTLDLVGPDALTGVSAAKIWSAALGRDVRYAGDDAAAFEQQMAAFSPAWLAYDMRLMMSGIQTLGMKAEANAVERLQIVLSPAAYL